MLESDIAKNKKTIDGIEIRSTNLKLIICVSHFAKYLSF